MLVINKSLEFDVGDPRRSIKVFLTDHYRSFAATFVFVLPASFSAWSASAK